MYNIDEIVWNSLGLQSNSLSLFFFWFMIFYASFLSRAYCILARQTSRNVLGKFVKPSSPLCKNRGRLPLVDVIE